MIIGIIGMVLVAVSSLPLSKSDKKSESCSLTVEAYEEAMEKELAEIVKAISGDKKPKVFLSLETGIRREYAGETRDSSNEKINGQQSEKSGEKQIRTITVKGEDGAEEAVTLIEHMPEIRGVAIVCKDGDNEAVREKIISAVTKALNITSKRVSVTGGNVK